EPAPRPAALLERPSQKPPCRPPARPRPRHHRPGQPATGRGVQNRRRTTCTPPTTGGGSHPSPSTRKASPVGSQGKRTQGRGQARRHRRRPQDRFETTRKERQEKRGRPLPRGSAGLQGSPAPAPRNRLLARFLIGQEKLRGLLQVLMGEGTD